MQVKSNGEVGLTVWKPEIQGLTVVLLGRFNPAILQPYWFAAQKLVANEEAANAAVEVITPQVVAFETAGLRVVATEERFVVSTTDPTSFDPLVDLVVGTFRVLEHTPIRMMGINPEAHFKLRSQADMNAIGFRLVPAEPWRDLLPHHEGMTNLQVRFRRHDGPAPGYVHVSIQPSKSFSYGVFLQYNEHYDFTSFAEEANTAERAMSTLQESFLGTVQVAHKTMSRIIVESGLRQDEG